MPSPTSRYWCFTFFSDISGSAVLPTSATYCVYQNETTQTTGRRHTQGYIEFDKPVSGGQKSEWVKAFIPGAHVEPKSAFSTREEAEHYCRKPCSETCKNRHCAKARKEGNGRIDWKNTQPTELGTQKDKEDVKKRSTQGKRTDIDAAIMKIRNGVSINTIIEEKPSLIHLDRHLERYKVRLLQPLDRQVKVIVLWGKAGTGKSRTARAADPLLFNKSHGEWWDGYTGQKTVLFDDFYGSIQYQQLLKVLDRYAYQVPVKGGFVWAQWDTVYITSNSPPHEWYKQGLTAALARRINIVMYYENCENIMDESETYLKKYMDSPQFAPPQSVTQRSPTPTDMEQPSCYDRYLESGRKFENYISKQGESGVDLGEE